MQQKPAAVESPAWPPVFRLTPAARPADAAPAPILQRLKMQDKFTDLWYDTADLKTFGAWYSKIAKRGEIDRLRKIYSLLERVPQKDRNEAIATSLIRSLLDVEAGSERADTDSPLAELPRKDWWKLFIEGNAQGKGHFGFDLEQSPGYYGAMMKAFEQELLPQDKANEPMTFAEYNRMHLAVTQGVLKSKDEGKGFEPVPHEQSGTTWGGLGGSQTQFPMNRPDKNPDNPSLDSIADMARDGEIALEPESAKWLAQWVKEHGGKEYLHDLWDLMKDVKVTKTTTALLRLDAHGHLIQHMVETNYAKSEVEGKVNAIFTRFYHERDTAKLVENKQERRDAVLKAIVRTVRSLHVGHFFADANGRLNTMLLLNKLLLAEGFTPVILPDTAIFGGEASADKLVQEVLQGLENFFYAVPPKQLILD